MVRPWARLFASHCSLTSQAASCLTGLVLFDMAVRRTSKRHSVARSAHWQHMHLLLAWLVIAHATVLVSPLLVDLWLSLTSGRVEFSAFLLLVDKAASILFLECLGRVLSQAASRPTHSATSIRRLEVAHVGIRAVATETFGKSLMFMYMMRMNTSANLTSDIYTSRMASARIHY